MDGITTMAKSTDTIQMDKWEPLIATWTRINSGQFVTGWTAKWEYANSTGSWKIKSATWALQDYTNTIMEYTSNMLIMKIVEHDMGYFEIILSTYNNTGDPNYQGFCSKNQNGKIIAIECPK